MTHKFDIKQKQKLDSPRRREVLPPEETLLKLGLTESDVVADIGCGIGYFTIPAARIIGDKGKVFALDLSQEMLEETKRYAADNKLANIEFLRSDEYSLPLQDKSISYCFSCNVLHEIRDLKRFIKELNRVLMKNGRLVIIEWNNNVADWGPPPEHRLDSHLLSELLQAEGLQVEQPMDISGYFYAVICRKDD